MKMQWKFWRRGDKENRKADTSSVAQSPEPDSIVPPLPAPGTVKELFGLQRLIGNQAVLQILAPNQRDAKVRASGLKH